MVDQTLDNNSKNIRPGILDTVNLSEQAATLRAFNAQSMVIELLNRLQPREADIITSRRGLLSGVPQTLEQIGKKLSLTRERVRQIENEATRKLKSAAFPTNLEKGIDVLFQIIESHGSIIREEKLMQAILNDENPVAKNCILFLLDLVPRFHLLKDNPDVHQGWYLDSFDRDIFDRVNHAASEVLKSSPVPIGSKELVEEIKKKHIQEIGELSELSIESMIEISKKIDRNPFEQWGLSSSTEIHPKDVGDKAFLILKHLGKPEHYSIITDLINKQKFDGRTAHKETVHNELIKDPRFVLVGRGIYALSDWGYKKGVVADIIAEILEKSSEPMTRDQILKLVLKQRVVKKNTIIVGLSNKKRFQKTADNKYVLINSNTN